MELFKNSSRMIKHIFNTIFPFVDFTYILQLEEYNYGMYLIQLFSLPYFKFLKRNFQKRGKIIFTLRALLTIILSIGIFLFSVFLTHQFCKVIYFKILFFSLIILCIPIIIIIGNILTLPLRLGYILQINKAKKKVQNNTKMKIIAITGSYGKTSTKNILFELLRSNYKVQFVQDNQNTAYGITKWINENLKEDTDILIVEMGAYSKGEIKKSISITPPDFAIITELGDQHLKRFKTFENLIQCKLEIFSLKKTNKYILDYVWDKLPIKQQFKNLHIIKSNTVSDTYNLKNIAPKEINITNVILGISVSKQLDVPKNFILDSIKHLKAFDRRRNTLFINDFEIIDESYNISLNTSKDSLLYASEYAKKRNKKLIVITAGIPESGINHKAINLEFGKNLSNYTQDIILLNSVFAKYIQKGFGQDLYTTDTMKTGLEYIFSNYSSKEYITLMFPELTDLSY